MARDVRPFGWRDKFGYMFGDFGNDFTFIMQTMFFMVFWTKVAGVSGAAIGLMFLDARIIDAFSDVLMGTIVDRSKPTKAGRFRPWLLRGAVPVAFASPPLGKKFGKKEIGIVGALLASAMYVVLIVLRTENWILFLFLYMVAQLGIGFINMIIWAMITDVIDYQEVRTGSRNDATVYAAYSWARKVGQAVGGGLGGFALSIIAYQPAADVQTPETIQGIYTFNTMAPAIGYALVAVLLWLLYPLSRSKVEENVRILLERRATAAAEAE